MPGTSDQLAQYQTLARVASVLLLWTVGCAAPLLSSYEHEKSIHCRIDNPDRDSLWDTSDTNGNGVIDNDETIGPVFDFAVLGGEFVGDEALRSTSSVSPSLGGSVSPPRLSQPGFRDYGRTIDGTPISNLTLLSGGDGIVDNLDGDTLNGFSFVEVDTDADGTIDVIVANGVDFDDLHSFNVGFSQFIAAPHTETHGMQISRKHRFTTKDEQQTEQYFELAYGARHLRLEESFYFEGGGSILGRTFIDMRYDNRLIGPQVALNWQRQQRGWNLQGGTTLMAGYNFARASQLGLVGRSVSPGAPNRPSSGPNDTFFSGRKHEEIATIAELSAAASYPLRRNVALTLGYRALYMSELRHAGESIDLRLPSFGILDRGANNAWLEGLHASVEWRR